MEIKGRIKDLCKAPSRAVRLFGGHLHMLFEKKKKKDEKDGGQEQLTELPVSD